VTLKIRLKICLVLKVRIKLLNLDSNDTSDSTEKDENEAEIWDFILKLRKNLGKSNIADFLKLRETNETEFDSKIGDYMTFLSNKITRIDKKSSKLIIKKLMLERIAQEFKQLRPGILNTIKVPYNRVFEESISDSKRS
jgi:hypothetical protein